MRTKLADSERIFDPDTHSSQASAPDRSFVTALARGLSVLRGFSDQDQSPTLAELARRVNLPRATVRRCLITLQALGYVHADGRAFRLSPQILSLAQAYLSSSALPRIAQGFLERVSEELGASCSVSVLHQQEVIYIARSARKRLASLHRDVGTHLPAHCTSMGRVLLAHLPEAEQAAFLATAQLEKLTPHTITSPARLRAVLEAVRHDGYCIVDQEMEVDLRSLALPLRNARGVVVAALHVSTGAGHTTHQTLITRHLPVLRQAAADMRPLLIG